MFTCRPASLFLLLFWVIACKTPALKSKYDKSLLSEESEETYLNLANKTDDALNNGKLPIVEDNDKSNVGELLEKEAKILGQHSRLLGLVQNNRVVAFVVIEGSKKQYIPLQASNFLIGEEKDQVLGLVDRRETEAAVGAAAVGVAAVGVATGAILMHKVEVESADGVLKSGSIVGEGSQGIVVYAEDGGEKKVYKFFRYTTPRRLWDAFLRMTSSAQNSLRTNFINEETQMASEWGQVFSEEHYTKSKVVELTFKYESGHTSGTRVEERTTTVIEKDFVEGNSLKKIMNNAKPDYFESKDFKDSMIAFEQQILLPMVEKGVVFGDINPDNLILTVDKTHNFRWVLIDSFPAKKVSDPGKAFDEVMADLRLKWLSKNPVAAYLITNLQARQKMESFFDTLQSNREGIIKAARVKFASADTTTLRQGFETPVPKTPHLHKKIINFQLSIPPKLKAFLIR